MDDDQFDGFVCFARSYLSDPNLTLDSTAAEGRARGYLFRDRPRGDPDGFLARLIRESKYDKSSWDALNLIAQKLIREGGLLEPTELAEWTADVLADQSAKRGHTTRPRPSKGGHATAGRDWNIYFLLGRLHTNWDLKPTRNVLQGRGYNKEDLPMSCVEGGSGCDVVGVAAGIPKYKTVEGIWIRCSHQMRNP